MFLANLYHSFPKIGQTLSNSNSNNNNNINNNNNNTNSLNGKANNNGNGRSGSSSNLLRSEEFAELMENNDDEKREERGN